MLRAGRPSVRQSRCCVGATRVLERWPLALQVAGGRCCGGRQMGCLNGDACATIYYQPALLGTPSRWRAGDGRRLVPPHRRRRLAVTSSRSWLWRYQPVHRADRLLLFSRALQAHGMLGPVREIKMLGPAGGGVATRTRDAATGGVGAGTGGRRCWNQHDDELRWRTNAATAVRLCWDRRPTMQ